MVVETETVTDEVTDVVTVAWTEVVAVAVTKTVDVPPPTVAVTVALLVVQGG